MGALKRSPKMEEDCNSLGVFHAIDSFLLTPMNLYGILGDLKQGSVAVGNFVRIPLNSTLAITAEIFDIQEVEFSSFDEFHKILFFKNDESDPEFIKILQAMRVGSEPLEIIVAEDI